MAELKSVVTLPGSPASVQELLAQATEANLVDVVIIGWIKDGGMFAADSTKSIGETLHLLEAYRWELMRAGAGE